MLMIVNLGAVGLGSSRRMSGGVVDQLQHHREAEGSARVEEASNTLHEQQPSEGMGRIPQTGWPALSQSEIKPQTFNEHRGNLISFCFRTCCSWEILCTRRPWRRARGKTRRWGGCHSYRSLTEPRLWDLRTMKTPTTTRPLRTLETITSFTS